jgi:hypothetical protein
MIAFAQYLRGMAMRLAARLLTVILALTLAPPAMARWLKAETENFIVYSEGNEKSLRSFAETLQRFDATLRYRFKIAPGMDSIRLPIYIVNNQEMASRLASGKSNGSVAGFYSAHPEGSFAVSNREDTARGGRETSQSQQILFHEYGHHFMFRYVTGAFPAWFVEGFAEFYSTVDFTKDFRAEIGKPVYSRAFGLLEMPRIPSEKLLTSSPGDMRNAGEADSYYGRSWLLTHMLLNDPTRANQLTAYINAINGGADGKDAATANFGDLAQLDKDLNRYMTRPLSYRTTAESIAITGTVTVTALSAAEDAVLPHRLERLSALGEDDRLIKVRDALTKLSATYGDDAGLWFELAATHWSISEDKRDAAAARTAVDRALAINPNHVRANLLLADMISEGLQAKKDFSAAAWRAVRAPISLANRTDPDDPLPLYAFYSTFVDQGVNVPDIAFAGLKRAFELGRENPRLRLSYIFALADRGDYGTAIKLTLPIAYSPHDDGNGLRLLNQLKRQQARAEGRELPEDEDEDTPASSAKIGRGMAHHAH